LLAGDDPTQWRVWIVQDRARGTMPEFLQAHARLAEVDALFQDKRCPRFGEFVAQQDKPADAAARERDAAKKTWREMVGVRAGVAPAKQATTDEYV
jgi:hypothetical protein